MCMCICVRLNHPLRPRPTRVRVRLDGGSAISGLGKGDVKFHGTRFDLPLNRDGHFPQKFPFMRQKQEEKQKPELPFLSEASFLLMVWV